LLFVILSILSGLGVRFALGYAKQTWTMTYHQYSFFRVKQRL